MLILRKKPACLNRSIFFFPVEKEVPGTLHAERRLWLLQLKIAYYTQYKEWNLKDENQIDSHSFHILSSNE